MAQKVSVAISQAHPDVLASKHPCKRNNSCTFVCHSILLINLCHKRQATPERGRGEASHSGTVHSPMSTQQKAAAAAAKLWCSPCMTSILSSHYPPPPLHSSFSVPLCCSSVHSRNQNQVVAVQRSLNKYFSISIQRENFCLAWLDTEGKGRRQRGAGGRQHLGSSQRQREIVSKSPCSEMINQYAHANQLGSHGLERKRMNDNWRERVWGLEGQLCGTWVMLTQLGSSSNCWRKMN